MKLVRRKMSSGAVWQQGPLIRSGVGSPLPSSVLPFVPFTLQGWVSCSTLPTPQGWVSYCLLEHPQRFGKCPVCCDRAGLWLQRLAVVGADTEPATSLLAPFLPSASLLSRWCLGFFLPFSFLFLARVFLSCCLPLFGLVGACCSRWCLRVRAGGRAGRRFQPQ